MNDERKRIVRADCADLATRFYYLIDRKRYREAADLFAPEGKFVRMGEPLVGPDQVHAALARPDPGKVVRHLVSNMVVEAGAPDRATIGYDLAVLIHRGPPGDAVPPVPPLAYMRDCVDEVIATPAGWRIIEKRTAPVFQNT
jgi:hypothetical protein